MAIVTLAALGLRLLRLGFQPLWWDEGWSVYFATTDLANLLRSTAVDIHPPLYYLLLKLWITLFGPGALAARLLSVCIGVISIPLIYLIGRRLVGEKGGLLVAALLAISPFHVYYSQEVRMYGLVTLLGLATFWFALGLMGPSRRTLHVFGYVLAATAALYTQYYAAFLLLALNLTTAVFWLRARRSMRDLVPWLTAQLAVLVLFLPWIWYAAGKLAAYVRFKVGVEEDLPLTLPTYLGRHLAAFGWGHAEGLLGDWWALGLLPLVLLIACLAVALRTRSRVLEMRDSESATSRAFPFELHGAWIVLVVLLACGFAVNAVLPFNPPRLERLLLLALPFYLLAFVGIVQFWLGSGAGRHPAATAPVAAIVVLGLASLMALYSVPRYPDDDYRPVAADVKALALPTDTIICVHPWQMGYFQAYLPHERRPALFLTPREVLPRERQFWADVPAQMAADLEMLLAEHHRLWVPAHQAMGRILESEIEAYLSEAAYPVQAEWYGESTVLSLYAASGSPNQPRSEPVTARFGDWLSLERAVLSQEPLQAGWGVATADLTWRVEERPDARHQVSLRLADLSGRVWAQRDSHPRGGLLQFYDWPEGQLQIDHYGLLVPAGTPPGDYRVTLRVYRTHDVAVLPASFSGGTGSEVTLGTVRIIRPQTPPPAEALSMEKVLRYDFGGRLRLVGASLAAESGLLPGEAVEVDLCWQTLTSPGEDFLARLQLIGDADQVVAERIEKPVAGAYPTAWWQPDELVRDPHSLPILATVAPGSYRLRLSLVRAGDGSLLEVKPGGDLVVLGQVEVEGRAHEYWPPIPSHPQRMGFGSSVELIGYDLQEVTRAPGSPLEVTLHWHAVRTPDRNYDVFVHLLSDSDGQMQIVAQHDGTPGDGRLPTLGWLPSEYLSDTHLLQLPFDLSDGSYRLGVGLYDPTTNQRLGDRAMLDATIEVKKIGGCRCR